MPIHEGCNLCGGARWEVVEERGGTRVVRCACGLVFVTPQPPRSTLEGAYGSDYYRAWDDQARRRRTIWHRRLKRALALAPPPGRLLDVGCGAGDFLRLARTYGWDVAGTELSPQGAGLAATAGLPIFTGELWEAGYPSEHFDLVTCWHVIEHVSDPRRVVAELFRVLRPGGYCLLATPNLDNRIFRAAYALARGRRARLYETDEREVHLYFFSAQTLSGLAAAVGFEEISLGFDRNAAAVWTKRLVNTIAHAWYRLSGCNWGMALEMVARRPPTAASLGSGQGAPLGGRPA